MRAVVDLLAGRTWSVAPMFVRAVESTSSSMALARVGSHRPVHIPALVGRMLPENLLGLAVGLRTAEALSWWFGLRRYLLAIGHGWWGSMVLIAMPLRLTG